MKKLTLYILLLLCSHSQAILNAQVILEDKSFCRINCDPAIHTENTRGIYRMLHSDSIDRLIADYEVLRFPIRTVYVKEVPLTIGSNERQLIDHVIEQLNHAFRNTKVRFYSQDVTYLQSELKIEDLSRNTDNIYDVFSQQNDLPDMITLYIMDHKKDFCEVTPTSISCQKTGGFSYILSGRNNNIVMSQFDLKDEKIVAHEFGHFFGLYHTFEEHLFGKDNFDEVACSHNGDLICDTRPDPGSVFEVYVNYSKCEMNEYTHESGKEYKPLIDNYMAYYKPCYLKEYAFTRQQEQVMTLASQLNLRKRLAH